MITKTQAIILKLLLNKSMTRYELVKESKIPRSTVYDNLEKLLQMNYINKIKAKRINVGRPRIFWFIEKSMLRIIKEKGFFSNNKFINQK